VKKIIILILLIVLLSCDYTPKFKVVTIDGCQYIHNANLIAYQGFMSHKGNCTNRIHK
jgi:hypothetical protein